MDKRAARRLITTWLAAVLRAQIDEDDLAPYGPEDRRRLRAARDELALELEVRAGLTPRSPRYDPPDPNQYALIHLEEAHAQDHPRAPAS